MPGTPFVYYGEELGLRPGTEQLVDSRDAARTPMLWSSELGFGFTSGVPWIAFGAEPETTNREFEQGEPDSSYRFYRALLDARRGRDAFGTGALRLLTTDQPSLLLWTRASADETYVMVLSVDEAVERTAIAPDTELAAEPVRLFGNATMTPAQDGALVTVPPAGMAIFRVR
jgi:glycosidase